MAGYQPTYISGSETGLVQGRVESILPNDAYPTLENAFVWRERIKRKQGFGELGRLRRIFTDIAIGNSVAGTWAFNIYTITGTTHQPTAEIEAGSVVITVGPTTFTDNGQGILVKSPAGFNGTINYQTGDVSIVVLGLIASTISFNYFPGLPVMNLTMRELDAINAEDTIAFDPVYAYKYLNGWQEFITGTTWTGTNSDFFWTTNYWVGDGNLKIFWVTNFSANDPIRYTNGIAWVNFAPTINIAGDILRKALLMFPFRGRMVTANTFEGPVAGPFVQYRQRIRWAAIGNPFSDISGIVNNVNPEAWRSDIRGRGGFLDIPTSENIVSMGFVRDNVVIYCESSTWQLRYTGRSIAPFQIERVNSELGVESTFSAVQFDTSLMGVGDKGIIECDSFKSQRIDIKIPDLVFNFNNENAGPKRIQGLRDFQEKLAFWNYPFVGSPEDIPYPITFPNRRLLYNYENDSWAIFTDSITALGQFTQTKSPKWSDFPGPDPAHTWETQSITWLQRQAGQPDNIGGNQQGFVFLLDWQTSNSYTLAIQNITGGLATVRITSNDHNLANDEVIEIGRISPIDPFFSINNQKYGVVIVDKDTFDIYLYNSSTDDFDIPIPVAAGTYASIGRIAIRDGFSIISKKFNYLQEAENIQIGFIDVLTNSTENGAFTLNVYVDYNDTAPVNRKFQNLIEGSTTNQEDVFFNSVVPTVQLSSLTSSKNWQRVICPARGAFITIEWTLSNAQLVGVEQGNHVEIEGQILFMRKAGRQLPVGV
jgi:hypothetical protein